MDTSLGLELKRRIGAEGPISVEAFMAACLYDAEHGYYTRGRNFLPYEERGTRNGEGGVYPHDFVTAPELGEVFGRTLARWVVKVWEEVGRPEPFVLMEAGPGRGVLMRDMLEALREGFPEVYGVVRPVLVEVSESLRELQAKTLVDFPQCEWRGDAKVEGKIILVANELLDAFPHRQLTADGERMVGLVEGELAFVGGEVVDERSEGMEQWLRDLPEGILAGCFLDYGAEAEVSGDTLQGVYRHTKVSPLEKPGEVDLTCHVNFRRVREVVEAQGRLEAKPLVGLADFLLMNGLPEVALANGPQGVVDTVLNRLLHPAEMGTLFKVQVFKKCSMRTRP